MAAVRTGSMTFETGKDRRLRLCDSPSPPSINPDFLLARAVAGGDVSALGELYVKHYRQVYAVCLNMTRNPAEAEDLTQDVFIHLVRKIGSFRGDSRFSTWLHRLTVNLVLMHMRRPLRREQPTLDSDNLQSIVPRLKERVPVQITDRIALQLAVSQLPRGCRAPPHPNRSPQNCGEPYRASPAADRVSHRPSGVRARPPLPPSSKP